MKVLPLTIWEDYTPCSQYWQAGLKYKAASHYQAPEGWEDRVTKRDDEGKVIKDEINQLPVNGARSETRYFDYGVSFVVEAQPDIQPNKLYLPRRNMIIA